MISKLQKFNKLFSSHSLQKIEPNKRIKVS